MEIKHSIVMICYNQEQYIRTALDSVLHEKVKPFEIIIGDDCSTDGTRAILEEYKQLYPSIIRLILNEKNIGIFANLNSVTSDVKGDVVSILAGDDWFKPKLLENMNNKIVALGLDPAKSKFMFLPKVVCHFPNGNEVVNASDLALIEQYSSVGAALRNYIHTRHTGISKALFAKWPLFPNDANEIGLWSDFFHYVMHIQFCELFVPLNCEGAVYRMDVGVASKAKSYDMERSYRAALLRLREESLRGALVLNHLDANYLDFLIASRTFSLSFSVGNAVRMIIAGGSVLKSNFSELGGVLKELGMSIRRLFALYRRRILTN